MNRAPIPRSRVKKRKPTDFSESFISKLYNSSPRTARAYLLNLLVHEGSCKIDQPIPIVDKTLDFTEKVLKKQGVTPTTLWPVFILPQPLKYPGFTFGLLDQPLTKHLQFPR